MYPSLIALEGISLSGKTTLCHKLGETWGVKTLPELSTWYNKGSDFPRFAESDDAATESDKWFLRAEKKRQRVVQKYFPPLNLIVMDRSFLSMIVFSTARKVVYDVGDPRSTASGIFSELRDCTLPCPTHYYLNIGPDEYRTRRARNFANHPVQNEPNARVRYSEQSVAFVNSQRVCYDFIFAGSPDRCIQATIGFIEIEDRLHRIKQNTKGDEIEYIKYRVSELFSKINLPTS